MHKIAVGQLFEPGVTRFDEMPEYNYRSGSHRLLIPMRNLTPQEIKAVKSADAKFAFTAIGDVIIFQYRFGSVLPWSDAAYTWHKAPVAEQIEPPQLTGNQRMLLEIYLIEATTGIVQAIRVVSLSPTFSRRLHKAISEQAGRPFPVDYDQQVARIFQRYTSQELRNLAIASCTGGDQQDRPSPY